MAEKFLELSGYSGSYYFGSQQSNTFKFRHMGVDGYFPYNPNNYIDQCPPMRGVVKNTIGGGKLKQYFGQFICDSSITFSCYLTREEWIDMINAKATGYTFKLKDWLGKTYVVAFNMEDGLRLEQKISCHNRYLVSFKFDKEQEL